MCRTGWKDLRIWRDRVIEAMLTKTPQVTNESKKCDDQASEKVAKLSPIETARGAVLACQLSAPWGRQVLKSLKSSLEKKKKKKGGGEARRSGPCSLKRKSSPVRHKPQRQAALLSVVIEAIWSILPAEDRSPKTLKQSTRFASLCLRKLLPSSAVRRVLPTLGSAS